MKIENIDEISQSFINCSWHVPVFILEICEVGKSSLPLKFSAQEAKIIIANMFKINRGLLSQNFYCDFYSSLFEQNKTVINAFHEVRRNIFKLTYDKKFCSYGLPVFSVATWRLKKKGLLKPYLKKIRLPQKTGGEAITTTQELLFANLNNAIRKLKPDADEISSAKRAIRCFFVVINTEDLKRHIPQEKVEEPCYIIGFSEAFQTCRIQLFGNREQLERTF